MGRSGGAASCFKIIACGSDSVDRDDLQAPPENKGSSDKRGWSFRKRSARHRVLSNTVISEAPSGNKDSPESDTVNPQAQAVSDVPEKNAATHWTDEKVSSPRNPKLSEAMTATEDDSDIDVTPDESVVIVIQAAIRGFLARRMLLKHKNVIKLQAAVRGHLVRRHAVGTLRCVQAIVKMQALVRARRARQSADKSENLNEKLGNDDSGSALSAKETEAATKSKVTNTCTEKLLSNQFARQLLESTPSTKAINIKCDPSKSDSAWKWLERWMAVSSKENKESKEVGLTSADQQENEKVEAKTSSGTVPHVADVKPGLEPSPVPTIKHDGNMNTYTESSVQPTSPSVCLDQELSQPQDVSEAVWGDKALDSLPAEANESDMILVEMPSALPGKTEDENEKHRHSLEKVASEKPEMESKKLSIGSRKASNPAFIAAQSKFEELSLAASSAKSTSSSHQDVGVESLADADSLAPDHKYSKDESDMVGSSILQVPKAQPGGSECGTELSITSTLDSPDRSEVGGEEIEPESKISEEGTHVPKNDDSLEVQANEVPIIQKTDLSYSDSFNVDQHSGADSDRVDVATEVQSPKAEEKPGPDVPSVQLELQSENSHQVEKSSPEASPRCHLTVPESQGTPSSQVSVKPKKMRSEKSGSGHKRKSLSAAKQSPSTPTHDSGARTSMEKLPKDQKSGKRRNSFGSAKSGDIDQEPRDSSSSNSLPSYMQATESARAKALASSSPRSSPDVQDKDIFIKKRHSLPGVNGRQGSPRIQRSMSQAQQSAKGNGANSPHERKWQR